LFDSLVLTPESVRAALLSDPMNIRYATDTHTFNVWTLHAPGRYVFVPVDGPVVLFEYGTCLYLATDLDSVDEVRKSVPWFYFLAGPRTMEKAELWSRDIIDLMRKHGGADQRLAVDRCEPWGARHLTDGGIQLFDAQEPLENARMIKTPEEIPLDYYSRITADAPLPMIVTEGGWTSGSVAGVTSSPDVQARYIRRQMQLADEAKLLGVFQITFTDLDVASFNLPPGSILPLFAKLGLVDANYRAKPALAVWDSVRTVPVGDR